MKININIKGISLIVLVVTVLVLAILAATVIISLNNANVIAQAKNAKNAANIAIIKEAANTIYADLYLSNKGNITTEDIINKLKEQGYTNEQLNLVSINVSNGNLIVKSKGVYGVKREVGSSSTSWERIEDSVGLVANACIGSLTNVQNDFDKIAPWSGIVSYNYDNKTNQVTAMYGDSNYKTDGTNGDVLTKIPEFYYKREQKMEDGKLYEYIYISEIERAGYTKSEEFSIGRYLSSFSDEGTTLKSVSGANVATNKNIVQFRALAQNTNYTLLDYRYFLLQLLYLVEYADYDSQSKLGSGHTSYRYEQTEQSDGTYKVTDKAIVSANNSNKITIALPNMNAYKVGQQIDIGTESLGSRGSSTEKYRTITNIEYYNAGGQVITFDGEPINIVADLHGIWSCAQNTGSADLLGMKSGYVGENGYSSIVYRGIEDFYGNVFQFIDGINIKPTGEVYVSYNSANYTSDKFDGDYEFSGCLMPTSGGYTNMLGYSELHPLISITSSITMSYNMSLKDYYWSNKSNYNRVGIVGGRYYNANADGVFSWHTGNSSSSSALHLGSRILR